MVTKVVDFEQLAESFTRAIGNMDIKTIEPISNFVFHPLFAKEWIARMQEARQRKGLHSFKGVAESIGNASHLRAQLMFLLMDMDIAESPKDEKEALASFFFSLLEQLAKKDICGFESNIKHADEEISAQIAKLHQEQGTEVAAKLIGRLYSAAYHFVNGLYTDFYTDYGAENIGPYHLGDGKILVIRDFPDLQPLLLWPHLKDVPCKKLRIYTIYKDVMFRCDAISVHTVFEGDLSRGLVSYAVEVDGMPVNHIGTLKLLAEKLEQLAVEQWEHLVSLDKEHLKRKCLLMRCYSFKDFFELLGMHWLPTKDMIEAIKDKPLAFGAFRPPEGEQREYWKAILHPLQETP